MTKLTEKLTDAELTRLTENDRTRILYTWLDRHVYVALARLADHHGVNNGELLEHLILAENDRISESLGLDSPEYRKFHKPVEPFTRRFINGEIVPHYRYLPESLPPIPSRKA